MKIDIDTNHLSPREARALIALLLSLHPDASPEELRVSVGNISVSGHASTVTNVLNQTDPVVMTVAEVQADPNRVFAAPPAPQPPAASAAPAPPPSAGPVGDRDSKGLPWDERIHSSSKAINASDGTWRSKRGVSNEEIKRVTAELTAGGAPSVPQPPSAAPAPPATAPAPPPVSTPDAGAPSPSPSGQTAPPTASPSDRDTFLALLQRITGGQNASPPTLTVARTNELVTGLGLQFLRDFMTRAELIPSMNALLDSEGVA